MKRLALSQEIRGEEKYDGEKDGGLGAEKGEGNGKEGKGGEKP